MLFTGEEGRLTGPARIEEPSMTSPPPVASTQLLCDVWREVCRHLHIEESAAALHPLLQQSLGIDALAVRRWDAGRSHLDTVASAGIPGAPVRVGVPTPRRGDLEGWARAGKVVQWLSRGETSLARLVVPEHVDGPVVAGPLLDGTTFLGVAIFGGDHRTTLELLQALLEPLSMALVNDGRLHELARLREAADADRRALLSRLDREDVSNAVVGADGGLRMVMERVAQVAPTDAPVLILGETGSGKEVVARTVHARSRRADGPFLRINCGAIPPELVDSELFGHERGSFTGAVATRKGWFERSDGGTLFLDELGELPAAAQVRLLRVLQDGTFERVGGHEVHTVDVRIVAATHRDMAEMVRDGRFRQDLWYRVSVFPIALPSLRERPDDIPPLARHFAERAGTRLFGRPLFPSESDIARLLAYEWPGNVRELQSVIERAAILGNGHGLDVNTALGGAAPPSGRAASLRVPVVAPAEDRATILEALRRAHGRIEGPFGAARMLGVNPHTLRSRMRRLGIEWSQFRAETWAAG